LSAKLNGMHKTRMIPLALSAGSGTGALSQRLLRHARSPLSLPALAWKNIKYEFDSRRPGYWNELGRRLAARGRYEAVKRQLAQQHPHDRRSYTLAKSTVIRELLDAAEPAPGAQTG